MGKELCEESSAVRHKAASCLSQLAISAPDQLKNLLPHLISGIVGLFERQQVQSFERTGLLEFLIASM